jgi:hypothetical protein
MFVSTKDRYVRRAIELKATKMSFGSEVVYRLWPATEGKSQPQPVNNFGEAI